MEKEQNNGFKKLLHSLRKGIAGKEKTASVSALGIKHEWHCHLLPGVDDGVQTPEEGTAILKEMVSAGYTHVTITPHMNPDIYTGNTEQNIKGRYGAFVSSLPEEITSRLEISLGGEYMVTAGFEDRDISGLLQFDNGKILIEMSYLYPSRNIEEAIFAITSSGYTPVLAHPERYIFLADHLDRFERFRDMGCEFQLNILSLKGVYGPGSARIMNCLLRNGMYSYLGSDTHTLSHFKHIQTLDIRTDLAELVKGIVR